MKALILSGGQGSRLRPITCTSPKQLVPVANKPVLYFYRLDAIAAAGITDVGIIVGQTGAEIPRQSATAPGGVRSHLHPPGSTARPGPRGPGRARIPRRGRLRHVPRRQFPCRRDQQIVGDFRFRPDAQVLLTKVADPTAFGVAETSIALGRLAGLVEKPARPRSDLAVAGVYIFTPAIHEAVRAISLAGAVSWRSATRSSTCSTTARRRGPRRPPATGRTQETSVTCWR